MTDEIKYRFALDQNGWSTDIRSLRTRSEVVGRQFYCLGCGEPLIPRLGSEVAHHFAHKSNTQCSGETYLHKLAKKVFQEEYERCLVAKLPFVIELEQRKICNRYPGVSERTCYTQCRPQTHDLIRTFEVLTLEAKNGDFVPDITLASRDRRHQIFVEFKVTHGCSMEKRGSNHRIIEISVQREEDLQPLRDHRLSFSDGKITFQNFKKNIPNDMCEWFSHCQLAKKVFIKLKNGDYKMRYMGKDQQLPEDAAGLIEWTKEEFIDQCEIPTDQFSSDMDLEASIADALQDGRSIRYCKFCEHFDYWGTKECSKFDERVEMTRAVECPYWSRIDYEDYMAILADG